MELSLTNPPTSTAEISFMTSSSSSSSVVASNVDLLTQILLRLPAKPLLVFKSVSKHWYSLISNPTFVRNHFLFRKTLPIPGFFLQKPTTHQVEFVWRDVTGSSGVNDYVPFKTLPFGTESFMLTTMIIRSCNGLLLCSSTPGVNYLCNKYLKYYIYNPTTKHYKTLPSPPSIIEKGNNGSTCMASLAFDPLKSPHYQVVFISKRNDKEILDIEIYSSETSTWRISGGPFLGNSHLFLRPGVFWNGSLHWFNSLVNESCSRYFDIDQESVKKMPLPPVLNGEYEGHIGYFGECKGHMHLIRICDPRNTCLDVLEMETDYTRWNVKYRVNLEALATSYPEMVEDYGFTVFLVEENEASRMVFRVGHENVFSYDLKEMSFKKLHDLQPGDYMNDPYPYHWSNAHLYIESLIGV